MSVFVTVGTTSFDDLVEKITSSNLVQCLKNNGFTKLVIQYGRGKFEPENKTENNFSVITYKYKDSISSDIKDADLVISHAGAGSCLEILGQKKKLIVVVNETLMNNHQYELAQQLHADGHLLYCTPKTLEDTICEIRKANITPFEEGDSSKFGNYMNEYFGIKT